MAAQGDTGRRPALHRFACWWIGFLGAAFLRTLGATWRLRWSGFDPLAARDGTPLVTAIWHGGLLPAAFCWRDRGIVVAVSRSRDGDRIDAVLRRLGFASSARGSSSRGATSVLRELIRRTQAGEVVALLADGPRGPAGVAKPGAVALARATGTPLVAAGIAASPAVRFGSWDRTVLPLPFARVSIVYGAPLTVPRDADEHALEAARAGLEAELHRLDQAATKTLG